VSKKIKENVENNIEEIQENLENINSEESENLEKEETDSKSEKLKNQEKIENHKYPITSFIEDNMLVRKKVGGGFAFQTYYKFTLKGNSYDKKTMKEWEDLFKKFLKSPVDKK
jgi:hypothetical protein